MIKKFILLTSLIATFASQAETIKLQGLDGFNIYGEYTAAKQMTKNGVLMLHQCNSDKSMYAGLAKQLSEMNISSMSLDFRGYGESITEELSIAALREKATSRKHYFEMSTKLGIGTHRKDDVEIAYQYLLKKLGKETNISFIGASCGGTQAVILAQTHKPKSFVFFSAGMSQETKDLFAKVNDVPALMIGAQGDAGTFKSLQEIFSSAQSNFTRMLSYKGKGHGNPLFDLAPHLETYMAKWFKQHTNY